MLKTSQAFALLFFLACLSWAELQAQSQADQAKIEQAQVQNWRKANPQVKIVPRSALGAYSPAERAFFESSSNALIIEGQQLSLADIQTYQSQKAHLPAQARQEAQAAPNGELERLRREDPQAYKALFANPSSQTQAIRRSEYQQMPPAKKAAIDANPQRYRLVD